MELGRAYRIAVLICELDGFSVLSMKRRHLADVLLKILGLSCCLNGIQGFISPILACLQPLWYANSSPSLAHDAIIRGAIANAVSFAAVDLLGIGLGILVIVKSRKIAEFWFKDQDE